MSPRPTGRCPLSPPCSSATARHPSPPEWPSQPKLRTGIELCVDDPPIVQATSRCCAKNTCSKRMFQVFQMFQRYVASVSDVSELFARWCCC
jgi:hypothetical protein